MAADRSVKLARRFNHYRQSNRAGKKKNLGQTLARARALARPWARGLSFDIRVPRRKVAVGKTGIYRKENFHRRHCNTLVTVSRLEHPASGGLRRARDVETGDLWRHLRWIICY